MSEYRPHHNAALANCHEIQDRPEHLSAAVDLIMSLPDNQQPTSCSICLEDLHWHQPSEHSELKITLPACLHSFHLHCLGEWRGNNDNCPECRTPISHLLDQMLLAGTFLHGENTVLGKTCRKLSGKVQGAQSDLRQRAEDVDGMAASVLQQAGQAGGYDIMGILTRMHDTLY